MPTSTYMHIPALVSFMQTVMPETVLDVGVGNGKMGFIARDLLDVMLGQRYKKEEWRVRIDGIEVFEPYLQDHQRTIYDHLFVGDALDVIDSLSLYDLIIIGDVLEHFEKHRALRFLGKCFTHCNHAVILSIPLGDSWKQEVVHGNVYEAHRSHWTLEEIECFATNQDIAVLPGIGPYGCFLITKEDYEHYRIRQNADNLFAAARREEAVTYLETSLAQREPNLRSEYVMVDLLLRMHRITDAIERLKGIHKTFPQDRGMAHAYIAAIERKLRVELP